MQSKAGRLLFSFSGANVVLSFQTASTCSVGALDATLRRLDAFSETLGSAGYGVLGDGNYPFSEVLHKRSLYHPVLHGGISLAQIPVRTPIFLKSITAVVHHCGAALRFGGAACPQ